MEKAALEVVQQLVAAFESGNSRGIEDALTKLGAESSLYRRVGQMTRQLHNSLQDFKQSLDPGSVTMNTTNLPDAADKLERVIQLTFEAANKTLSLAEHHATVLTKQRQSLTQLERISDEATTSKEDLRHAVQTFLEEQVAANSTCQQINCEILLAQEFQDLTGQALRKVITLVTGLELQMVELVKLFGLHEAPPTASHPLKNGKTPDVGCVSRPEAAGSVDQSEVDALLSDLGF